MDHPAVFFSSFDKNHYANIHRKCWRESLKICKFTKLTCKGQASKASIPQNHKVAKLYRPSVCMVGRPEGGGGGSNLLPPKIETFETFPEFAKLPYICVSFQQMISNLATLLILRRSFQPYYGFFLTGSSMKKLYTQLKNSQSIVSYSWVSQPALQPAHAIV